MEEVVFFDALLERFPRERTWLLPALHAAQEALGWLSDDTLARVAGHLRVPASEVYGVATGYPEFRLRPQGAHHVRYCTGVTCTLLGGRDLAAALQRRCATSSDTTLEPADCFFQCSAGPLIEVDHAYRGRVTVADAERVEQWFAERDTDHARRTGPVGGRGLRSEALPLRSSAPSPAATRPARLPESLVTLSAASAADALRVLVDRARDVARERPTLRLLVHVGTCGRAVGADLVFSAIRGAVARRGLDADVVEGACNGACYAAPVVEIEREGWPRAFVESLDATKAAALVDALAGDGEFARAGLSGVVFADAPWQGLAPAGGHPFWGPQERVLLSRWGRIDPGSLDDALLDGAYAALAKALDGAPDDVIAQVKAASLQGRGGAFFPTAVKWEGCARAAGEPRYVVMNGEEGEPGIFKDRHLLEGDPHNVLEGVLLAAYAARASRAFLYIHGEAHLSAERMAQAVADAYAAGLAGERILGRPFSCEIEIRRGAGGFVLGEETALLESIEGRRAQPRTRPPFPVESGLWRKPTVINNVETLATIPAIVSRGGAWFAGLGTPRAAGTKIFGLSGPIRRPGVVEVRNGVTLGTLLTAIGGGAGDGRPLRGALVGGPSGTIVPASLFGAPMEPRERVNPGTGGIVAIPTSASIVAIVKILLGFNARESCGKCTPCREGVPRLLGLIDELGTGAVADKSRELGEAIRLASLCGLGQAAPLSLLAALETFPEEFGSARSAG